MKHLILLVSSLLLLASCGREQSVCVRLDNGDEVRLTPVAKNAVRVQIGGVPTLPELTYLPNSRNIDYSVSEADGITVLSTSDMRVEVCRQTGVITYSDAETRLVQNAYSLTPVAFYDTLTHVATAVFDSPEDEALFGLGQFQDGYLNVRGLSRRLTQVNTQIAIPMVTSSRGYSLLWNNYGLTDFNPCANSVTMSAAGEGGVEEVNVTSTEGGRKERRQSGSFEAVIEVDEDADYTLLLDVGQTMARSHNLTVDGQTVIDMHNLWLPPTTSTIVHLSAGQHTLTSQLTAADRPTLYYNKVEASTVWQSPVADCVDYTVFMGDADNAIASYRSVTGHSPLQPLWAFGYVHCRERFHSTAEILANAREFRQRQLPMDVMVQDWQWWGKYGWNAFRFDESAYPEPRLLVDSLHAMGSRLMLSVWSKIDGNSEVGKRASELGYYIPGTTWIDFFNREASDFYWANFTDSLLRPYGIDCWWQDATEPENDDLVGRIVQFTDPVTGITAPEHGERLRCVYPNFVSRAVYEGSRRDAPDHRTLILTRSAAPGLHRYGSFIWSGDVGHDWQTMRYQLTAGLGAQAAGHPWWTFDAGGFFRPWGQYSDPAYHERFLRWLQIATFLPMMRVHGYMTDTEFWRFGEMVETQARRQLELRYSLVPYIYSVGYQVSNGYTMMRPLVMDFRHDADAMRVNDQYMFGPSLMVCPVMEPSVSSRPVYLPQVAGGWYDFHTGQHIEARCCGLEACSQDIPVQENRTYGECGISIDAPVSLDQIPVYVRAGSIIPRALPMQTTAAMVSDTLMIDVYPGADGHFDLYSDDGVSYSYENGQSSLISLTWDDAANSLTIGARRGSYPAMPSLIHFIVRTPSGIVRSADYTGQALSVDVR
ncbi:MAG: DUF5110 domain-containing protein [Bacteroidales bacterium]|nr:DUF5110 domain-containing protein [Candidatus Liminaster caballi]